MTSRYRGCFTPARSSRLLSAQTLSEAINYALHDARRVKSVKRVIHFALLTSQTLFAAALPSSCDKRFVALLGSFRKTLLMTVAGRSGTLGSGRLQTVINTTTN